MLHRFLSYIESYNKTFETKQVKMQLLTKTESSLARLRILGTLNGLNDYELYILIFPKLKEGLHEKNDTFQKPMLRTRLLQTVSGLVIFLALLLAFFTNCTPCQRLLTKFGRNLIIQVKFNITYFKHYLYFVTFFFRANHIGTGRMFTILDVCWKIISCGLRQKKDI